MNKVLIGMATGGTIRSETVTSLVGAMDTLKKYGVDVGLSIQIGGYVAVNRNNIVQSAQDHDCSHIMFIDNDMIFPVSGIQRLLDHDKDIVGGAYNARQVEGKPLISTVKLTDDYTSGKIANMQIPRGLFKCYGMGTGFMMVKTSVFDKFDKKEPYFREYEDKDGHHTEDIDFCQRAIKKGFDVWCNSTIDIGHIGTKVY